MIPVTKRRNSVSPRRGKSPMKSLTPISGGQSGAWQRSSLPNDNRPHMGRESASTTPTVAPMTPAGLSYLSITLENVFMSNSASIPCENLRLIIRVGTQEQSVDPIECKFIKKGPKGSSGNLIKFGFPTITFGVTGNYENCEAVVSVEHITRSMSGKVMNPSIVGSTTLNYSNRFIGQYDMAFRGFPCGQLAAVMEVMEESYLSDDASLDSCAPPTPSPASVRRTHTPIIMSPLASPQLLEAAQQAHRSLTPYRASHTNSPAVFVPVLYSPKPNNETGAIDTPNKATIRSPGSLSPVTDNNALETSVEGTPSPVRAASAASTPTVVGTPIIRTQNRVEPRHSITVLAMMVLQYMLVILPIVVLLLSPVEAESSQTVQATNISEPDAVVEDMNPQDLSEAAPVVVIEAAIDGIIENISPIRETVSWGEHFACCM